MSEQETPLSEKEVPQNEEKVSKKPLSPSEPVRMRLPDERRSITHKFVIIGGDKQLYIKDGKIIEIIKDVDVYITVSFYADGKLGEIFIKIGKQGDDKSGIYDSFAVAISLALQYGVPVDVFIDKFAHTRFEPAGPTKNQDIAIAKSILDYIFRWLKRFSEETRNSGKPKDAGNGDSGNIEEAASATSKKSGTEVVPVQPGDSSDKTETATPGGRDVPSE